jgi:AraC-like DNA-binding protein
MERLNESRIGGVITDAFAARASTSLVSTPHARHGASILVGLDSDVRVTEPGRPPISGRVIVVPPDRTHAASCRGPTLMILHDPEVAIGLASYARLRDGAFPLEGRSAARLSAAVATHGASLSRPDVLSGLARESAALFAGESPRLRPDRRVARVVEALRDPVADRRIVIERIGLSDAHLQALFVRDVGVPIRTFRLWRRLLVAIASCLRLDSTSAAHAAGFADLAHFSRTCRKMLGSSPTELRRGFLP